jgi:hypothetical protein
MEAILSLHMSEWLKYLTVVMVTILPSISAMYSALKDEKVQRAIVDLLRASTFKEWRKISYQLTIALSQAVFSSAFFKAYIAFLNRSLNNSIDTLHSERAEAQSNEDAKAKTIVGLMLNEKKRRSNFVFFFLFLAMALDFTLKFTIDVDSGWWVMAICSGLLALLQVDHKLIEYRINRGWYGMNAFETLEIVRFISTHSDPDDFNDEDGIKRIRPSAEFHESIWDVSEAPGVKI